MCVLTLSAGDVIAVKKGKNYSYFVILSKIALGGGNFAFVFSLRTRKLLKLSDLLSKKFQGFNAFVDFLYAKKKKRISKLGRVGDYSVLIKQKHFTNYDVLLEKWLISEIKNSREISLANIREAYSVPKGKLSKKEKNYPQLLTFPVDMLIDKINAGWSWEKEAKLTESM